MNAINLGASRTHSYAPLNPSISFGKTATDHVLGTVPATSAQNLAGNPLNGYVLTREDSEFFNDIELISFDWKIANSGQSRLSPGEFNFSALQTEDSPFLLETTATGTVIDQLVLVSYNDVNGDGKGEVIAQFTLENVLFTDYQQSSTQGEIPVDNFSVTFEQFEAEYTLFDSQTGNEITERVSNVDFFQNISSAPIDFGGSDLVGQADRILSFGEFGDIEVRAFTTPSLRVETNGNAGRTASRPLVTDGLVIETTLNEASPDLIAALATGTVLSDVVLSDYTSIGDLSSQWSLSQATVTSFEIDSGETPEESPIVSITLTPQDQLTQTVNIDTDNNGTLDNRNTVVVDVTGSVLDVADTGVQVVNLSDGYILTLEDEERSRDIELISFDFDLARSVNPNRPGQSRLVPGEFTFSALQTGSSPFLLQTIAAGTVLDQLVLVSYDDVNGDGKGEAVAQFTLENVVLTDYQQSSDPGEIPVDDFSVTFERFEAQYTSFDSQTGNELTERVSNVDFSQSISSEPGDFGGSDLVGQADRILSFGKFGDIEVSAFTTPGFRVETSGNTGGATSRPSIMDGLVIETALNEASPDLIAALATGTVLSDVVLSDYGAVSGELLSQWSLSQATVTSFELDSGETPEESPIVRVTLAPQDQVTQTVSVDTDSNGTLDSSNTVVVDVTGSVLDVADTGVQVVNPSDGYVLTLEEDGRSREIELISFDWEITNPEQSRISSGEFNFSALQTGNSPFLLETIATGTAIDKLVLVNYDDVNGDGKGEAVAQFTLENVLLTNYQQGGNTGERPVDSFSVSFQKFETEYTLFDPQTGNELTERVSSGDFSQSIFSAPIDFGGTDLVGQATRILSFGEFGDIEVSAFTAPQLSVGRGLTVDELVIETTLNEASPDLISALTTGTLLSDVVLSDYSPAGELLSQWSLSQATITSFEIDSEETPEEVPIVRFTLTPQGKLTQTVNVDTDNNDTLDSGNTVTVDVNTRRFTAANNSINGDNIRSADLDIGLYDADSGALITILEDGDELLASTLVKGNATISASVPDGRIESVLLNLNNGQEIRQDNLEPYTLFDGLNNGFQSGTLPVGRNTVVLDLYSQDQLQGDFLGTVTREFTVINDIA